MQCYDTLKNKESVSCLKQLHTRCYGSGTSDTVYRGGKPVGNRQLLGFDRTCRCHSNVRRAGEFKPTNEILKLLHEILRRFNKASLSVPLEISTEIVLYIFHSIFKKVRRALLGRMITECWIYRRFNLSFLKAVIGNPYNYSVTRTT